MTATTDERCRACDTPLVAVNGAVPWCPRCERGLALLEPGMRGDIGWGWLDRWAYRRAFRSTMAEFRRLSDGSDRQLERRARHPADVVVTAAALLIHAVVAACLVTGVWLATRHFPSLALVPGALLVLIAVELRPRLGRLPRHATVLRPDEAPQLHALVERVAAAVGAPVPAVICLDDQFNASAGAYGLRRRRALVLGVPLWQSMSAQQRVALLGHELGHFVNGDPRRGLVVQPVYRTLSAVAALLTPTPQRDRDFIMWLSEKLLAALYGILRFLVRAVQFLLVALAQREGQRAEYRADMLAASAAGSAAAAELTDLSILSDQVLMLIGRDARAGAPVSAWRTTAAGVLANARPHMAVWRQLSIRREVSLFASHPPSGLRARLIESHEQQSAAVILDEATNDSIDNELGVYAKRTARNLKHL